MKNYISRIMQHNGHRPNNCTNISFPLNFQQTRHLIVGTDVITMASVIHTCTLSIKQNIWSADLQMTVNKLMIMRRYTGNVFMSVGDRRFGKADTTSFSSFDSDKTPQNLRFC